MQDNNVQENDYLAQLPKDLHPLIFNYFNIQDLVNIVSLVDKNWHQFVNRYIEAEILKEIIALKAKKAELSKAKKENPNMTDKEHKQAISQCWSEYFTNAVTAVYFPLVWGIVKVKYGTEFYTEFKQQLAKYLKNKHSTTNVKKYCYGADLSSLFLTNVDLTKADLTNANLTEARLCCTNLTDANLTGANLASTKVCSSAFKNTNLTNVNLKDADLLGADFKGATFSVEQLLSAKSIRFIKLDETTFNHNKFTADDISKIKQKYISEAKARIVEITGFSDLLREYKWYKETRDWTHKYAVTDEIILIISKKLLEELSALDSTQAKNITKADRIQISEILKEARNIYMKQKKEQSPALISQNERLKNKQQIKLTSQALDDNELSLLFSRDKNNPVDFQYCLGVLEWSQNRNNQKKKSIPFLDANDSKIDRLNLSGYKLRYADFSCAQLSNIDFVKSKLTDACFSNAKLDNVNFSHAKLDRADFSAATFKKVNFSNTDLRQCSITTEQLNKGNVTSLKNAQLDNQCLQKLDLKETNLDNASFKNCDLSYLGLESDISLANTSFENAKLEYARFNYCDLSTVNFLNANLNNATICNATINKQTLLQAKSLRGIKIDQATLKKNNYGEDNLIALKQKIVNDYKDFFNESNDFLTIFEELYRLMLDKTNVLRKKRTGIFDYGNTDAYATVMNKGRERLLAVLNDYMTNPEKTNEIRRIFESQHDMGRLKAIFEHDVYTISLLFSNKSCDNAKAVFEQIKMQIKIILNPNSTVENLDIKYHSPTFEKYNP